MGVDLRSYKAGQMSAGPGGQGAQGQRPWTSGQVPGQPGQNLGAYGQGQNVGGYGQNAQYRQNVQPQMQLGQVPPGQQMAPQGSQPGQQMPQPSQAMHTQQVHETRLENGETWTAPNGGYPDLWVTKWVDYSAKYGVGYLCSDRTIGVSFFSCS